VTITTYASVAGDYMQTATIGQVNKVSGTAITKGDILYLNTSDNTFTPTTNAITTAERFAVAVEAAATTDTKVRAAIAGDVFVQAEGVINPHRMVICSSTDAKKVKESDGSPSEGALVGWYVGKADANERDGVALAACADDDIILIKLREVSY
jgi:hypothetical protein